MCKWNVFLLCCYWPLQKKVAFGSPLCSVTTYENFAQILCAQAGVFSSMVGDGEWSKLFLSRNYLLADTKDKERAMLVFWLWALMYLPGVFLARSVLLQIQAAQLLSLMPYLIWNEWGIKSNAVGTGRAAWYTFSEPPIPSSPWNWLSLIRFVGKQQYTDKLLVIPAADSTELGGCLSGVQHVLATSASSPLFYAVLLWSRWICIENLCWKVVVINKSVPGNCF